jgi:hypothetical protein
VDVHPGIRGSFPTFFTNLNGTAFFAAREPSTDRELWRGP